MLERGSRSGAWHEQLGLYAHVCVGSLRVTCIVGKIYMYVLWYMMLEPEYHLKCEFFFTFLSYPAPGLVKMGLSSKLQGTSDNPIAERDLRLKTVELTTPNIITTFRRALEPCGAESNHPHTHMVA